MTGPTIEGGKEKSSPRRAYCVRQSATVADKEGGYQNTQPDALPTQVSEEPKTLIHALMYLHVLILRDNTTDAPLRALPSTELPACSRQTQDRNTR